MEHSSSILEQLMREQAKNREKMENKTPTRENNKQPLEKKNSDGPDASLLSTSEKKEKLEQFLRRDQHRRRRRKKVTKSDVRNEAARILEEFLQAQLKQQSVQTSHKYERVVEVDVTETPTPSGESSGYLASKSSLLREDSIPFADQSDQELQRAESLPHDDFTTIDKGVNHNLHPYMTPVHEKSKSAPYAGNVADYSSYAAKPAKNIPPPPPAPPGTPHTPSEKGSSDSVARHVPYTGRHVVNHDTVSSDGQLGNHDITYKPQNVPTGSDVSDMYVDDFKGSSKGSSASSSFKHQVKDTAGSHSRLDHESASTSSSTHGVFHSRASSQTDDSKSNSHHKLSFQSKPHSNIKDSSSYPVVRPKTLDPSSPKKSRKSFTLKFRSKHDSSDTDSEGGKPPYTHGRKKKSMFKRAQGRLQTFFRLKKTRDSPEEAEPEDESHYSPKHLRHKKRDHRKGLCYTTEWIAASVCLIQSL